MSRLLVIEVAGGCVQGIAFDTGEKLDVSVAIIDHDESAVYRLNDVQQGGAEEILALVKSDGCADGMGCGAHNYIDEYDEEEK